MEKEMRSDFAVFILSHGRANNVLTLKTLLASGYSGKWYIIIDNEDEQASAYYENFGEEHIIMFDKAKKALDVDTCDNYKTRESPLFARESCFEIAKGLGLKYFFELDDDYYELCSRYEKNGFLTSVYIKDMDSILDACIDFLDESKAHCICFSQMGDFIGGLANSLLKKKMLRKAMNAFLCRVDKPFHFIGRINDDVSMYLLEGSRGKLFLTIKDVSINQIDTQKGKKGLSDVYRTLGTYVKSFYSIITNPSCVKIGELGVFHKRLHHSITWNNAVPCIISEKYKKH